MGNCFKNTVKTSALDFETKSGEFGLADSGYVKNTIPTTFKALVWDEYIGSVFLSGSCYCCGATIMRDPTKNKKQSYHCGHVTAERENGELWLGNCRPVCRYCNSSMGTKHMADYYSKQKNVDFSKLTSLRASSPQDPQSPYRKAIARALLGNIVELAISQEQMASLVPRTSHHLYIAEPIYDYYVRNILDTMPTDDLHFIARTIQPCPRASKVKLIDIIMPTVKNINILGAAQ